MSTLSVTNLKHESASGNNITLDSSDRVGIGTASPVEKLDVANGVLRFGNNVTPTTENDNAAYFGKVGGQAFVSNSGGFAVRDNGVNRLVVDSSGRVTMPYQPAFHAYGNSGGIRTSTGDFPFAGVAVNIGGHYNSSTYKFTAPVAGTYRFICSALITDSGQLRFEKNGSAYIGGDQSGIHHASGGYISVCKEVIMTMAVNDYVAVYQPTTNGIYTNWSTFSGHLIG